MYLQYRGDGLSSLFCLGFVLLLLEQFKIAKHQILMFLMLPERIEVIC